MEETLDILEETADIMDETLDVVEKLVEAKNMASADGLYISKGSLVGFVLIAAGVGYGLYKFGVNKSKTKYEALAKREIEEAKAFYSKMNKRDDFETPEKAAKTLKVNNPADIIVKDAVEAVRQYQGEDDSPEEEGAVNVFVQHSTPDENFDIDEEMRNRTPDQPYVINEQEFMENEDEFSQISITYYAGDGTLADERDQEIPFVEPIVGEDNLQRFGHGSNDPRIVYIRNERLSTDFEVVLSDGKYAHEVLGLQHSDGGARGRQQEKQQRKYRGEVE